MDALRANLNVNQDRRRRLAIRSILRVGVMRNLTTNEDFDAYPDGNRHLNYYVVDNDGVNEGAKGYGDEGFHNVSVMDRAIINLTEGRLGRAIVIRIARDYTAFPFHGFVEERVF